MPYIVEVTIDGHLSHELGQMRTWLDRTKFETVGFRKIPGKNICRVDFKDEPAARAFAEAFAGELLNRSAAQCRALSRSPLSTLVIIPAGGTRPPRSDRDNAYCAPAGRGATP